MNKSLLLLAAAAVLAVSVAGCAATEEAPEATQAPPTSVTPTESPSDEATDASTPEAITLPEGPPAGTAAAIAWDALMGPDGEYAASASYLAVIEKFGQVEPYVSIQAAEDRHSNALIRQLERLGVEVPENPYLGRIPAPADLETAAQAWAEGEVANIAMYDTLLTQTDDTALIRVLTNLRNASADSHLPLFEAAAANGGTLTPEQMANSQLGR